MTISIGELEAIERTMTDAPWQQAGKSEYIVYAAGHAIGDTTSVDDAAGIVAARNALPALLEIAKAALTAREAHDDSYAEGDACAHQTRCQATDLALDRALAKVRP